jgi:hypothetical protein
VHGCRLGVIGRYVDPLDIITPVANRVKLPSCFGAEESNSADLTHAISRLDPDAKRMVSEMAYRLAR